MLFVFAVPYVATDGLQLTDIITGPGSASATGGGTTTTVTTTPGGVTTTTRTETPDPFGDSVTSALTAGRRYGDNCSQIVR